MSDETRENMQVAWLRDKRQLGVEKIDVLTRHGVPEEILFGIYSIGFTAGGIEALKQAGAKLDSALGESK